MSTHNITPKFLLNSSIFLFITGLILYTQYDNIFNCSVGYINNLKLGWLDNLFRAVESDAVFLLPIALIMICVAIFKSSKTKIDGAVISIVFIFLISIISSLILASKNTSRMKSRTSAIRSNINMIVALAEIYHDEHYNYGLPTSSCNKNGSLFTESEISKRIGIAETLSERSAVCISDGERYAISIPFIKENMGIMCNKDPIENWCIDSTGVSKSIIGNIKSPSCNSDL